jgi:hypothetical protein
MSAPTYGVTKAGAPVHAQTRHYVQDLLSPREALKGVQGFNAKLAVSITSSVGTMACAYLFCVIALVSLPATLVKAGIMSAHTFPHVLIGEGLVGLISWIAQTFIQLVLLSIIMVGQRVQAASSDARAAKQFEDTTFIADQVNEKTRGGLQAVLAGQAEILAAIEAKGSHTDLADH